MFEIFKKWVTKVDSGVAGIPPELVAPVPPEPIKDISEPVLSLVELMKAKPSWFKYKTHYAHPNLNREFLFYNGKSLDITRTIYRQYTKSQLFTKDECDLIYQIFRGTRKGRLEVARMYLRARLEKKLKQTLSNINGDI